MAKQRGRGSGRAFPHDEQSGLRKGLAFFLALLLSIAPGGPTGVAFALPHGGKITNGLGTVHRIGNTLQIRQISQTLSLDWSRYDIGANQTVDYLQPGAGSRAFNFVTGGGASTLLGHLDANGQVWIMNPFGIVFGKGARVNVGGLVASALSLASWKNGQAVFQGGGGAVVNAGTIKVGPGGTVALVGQNVSNTGTIDALRGTIALGAGNTISLDFTENALVSLGVNANTAQSVIDSGGMLRADGGKILLTAGAQDSLARSAVNLSGVAEARTVGMENGQIVLLSGKEAGTTTVSGTLDASAPSGGNGGWVETSGNRVNVANGAVVTAEAPFGTTGTWTLDPASFYIGMNTGTANDTHGNVTNYEDISGSSLASDLTSTNVVIDSTMGAKGALGNIYVNDGVSWGANTTLTLNAYRNIDINAGITATGASGAVALYYGQGAVNSGNTATYSFGLTGSGFAGQINLKAGNNFSTKLGSDGSVVRYTVIDSLGTQSSSNDGTLQGMQGNLAGNYALGANIDATGTSTWNSNAGFTPIGNSTTNFTGTFDGLGHTISSLTINRPTAYRIGMFGDVGSGAAIRNVGLVGGSASGYQFVGELVGGNSGTISNSYATGDVSGGGGNAQSTTGGLVGQNGGTISNAYAAGNVSGGGAVGGLVGKNFSTISYSYATGKVTSGNYVGGLAGHNYGASSTISYSYATGKVTGNNYVGGLSGENYNGTISNSYATGSVSGGGVVGGLVGTSNHPISNSYATGSVSGSYNVGGLVGSNSGTLSNSYATGNVKGSSTSSTYVGGLVGWNSATVSNSYATGNVSGPQQIGGLVGYNYGAGGMVSNSYSAGSVSGSSDIGGLVGLNSGSVTNGFWNTTTSGQASSAGGTGLTTTQFASSGNFTGFSFNSFSSGAFTSSASSAPWYEGTITTNGSSIFAPILVGDMGKATVTATAATMTYSGSPYTIGSNYQSTGASLAGTVGLSSSSSNDVNVGSYTVIPLVTALSTGIAQTSAGFFTYVGGALTITPANLSATGTQVYNGTTGFSGSNLTVDGVDGQTFSASGSGTLGNSGNVQTNQNLASVSGLTLSGKGGALTSNYNPLSTTQASVSVTPAPLTASVSANKVYDGTDSASLSGSNTTFSGFVTGQGAMVNSGTTGTYSQSNVGTALAITGGPLTTSNVTANSGTSLSNYTLPTTDNGTGNITPANLSATGTQVYNGTTTFSGSNLTVNGVDGQTFSASGSGTLGNSGNVQTNQNLASVSGLTLSGKGGALTSNYNPLSTTQTSVSVTPAPLTYSGSVSTSTPATMTYDGKTSVSLTTSNSQASLSGFVSGQSANYTGATGTFASPNAGTGIGVTATLTTGDFSNSGTGFSWSNYTVPTMTLFGTGNITARTITLSGTKTYDGGTGLAGDVTLGNLVGTQTLTYGGATANSADVGSGNYIDAITLGNGSNGGLASNYQLPTLNATNAPVTITASGLPTKEPLYTLYYAPGTSMEGVFGETVHNDLALQRGNTQKTTIAAPKENLSPFPGMGDILHIVGTGVNSEGLNGEVSILLEGNQIEW